MALKFDSLKDQAVVQCLLQGMIGVIPTDTVYGLACRAMDQEAVKRLYGLKNRERKPGTVIAVNPRQLEELGIRHAYLVPVTHYWPSAISILLPVDKTKLVYLHQELQTLAVRVPEHALLSRVLDQTGPLLTTSANWPGEAPAGTIAEAEKIFNEQVDFYVDGGDLAGHLPSTLIRIIDDAVVVLRKGAVNINDKGEVVR